MIATDWHGNVGILGKTNSTPTKFNLTSLSHYLSNSIDQHRLTVNYLWVSMEKLPPRFPPSFPRIRVCIPRAPTGTWSHECYNNLSLQNISNLCFTLTAEKQFTQIQIDKFLRKITSFCALFDGLELCIQHPTQKRCCNDRWCKALLAIFIFSATVLSRQS